MCISLDMLSRTNLGTLAIDLSCYLDSILNSFCCCLIRILVVFLSILSERKFVGLTFNDDKRKN